jgi:hypothetical protein
VPAEPPDGGQADGASNARCDLDVDGPGREDDPISAYSSAFHQDLAEPLLVILPVIGFGALAIVLAYVVGRIGEDRVEAVGLDFAELLQSIATPDLPAHPITSSSRPVTLCRLSFGGL